MMNLDGYKVCENYELNVADKWIWSTLNNAVAEVHKHITNYRFDLVANTIYDFVWNNYCDWYLEFAKVSLKDESLSEKQKNGVKYTLAKVLENIEDSPKFFAYSAQITEYSGGYAHVHESFSHRSDLRQLFRGRQESGNGALQRFSSD